jgi:hypothetical protein
MYCSPFALNLGRLDVKYEDSIVGIEELTIGCNLQPWQDFANAIATLMPTPPSPPAQQEAVPPPAELKPDRLHLNAKFSNISFYYQPTSSLSKNPILVVPPRALLSLSFLHVNHIFHFPFQFRFDERE